MAASKQAGIDTYPRMQCSLASVGFALCLYVLCMTTSPACTVCMACMPMAVYLCITTTTPLCIRFE